jgi:hypothetical protein
LMAKTLSVSQESLLNTTLIGSSTFGQTAHGKCWHTQDKKACTFWQEVERQDLRAQSDRTTSKQFFVVLVSLSRSS